MSLNYLLSIISNKALIFISLALILASCGISKSSLTTKKTSSLQEDILTYSKKHLGKPYRYSGKGPNSFDCSGFTSFVFSNFGYKLPSSSPGQDRQFPTITKKEDLAIGDLVFFEGRRRNGHVGHVGIVTEKYPNNNFNFIHSSTSHGVIISSSTEPYYSSRYLRGGRVIIENKIYENTYITQKSINSEPEPPLPAIIIVQNKSNLNTEYISYKNSKIDTNNNSDELNHNHAEKEKKEKKETSELNSDIILRDDTILIPAPIKIHTVKMGETLYSISKQYECTVKDLISWNPQLGSVLKTGDNLQIVKH